MKDIPLFTVSDGMASLILREIPFRGAAYIWVRSVFGSLDGLLQECAAFCRAAGAEKVYATGQADFSAYPVYARLIQRSVCCQSLPATEAIALPAKDAAAWLQQYRERFRLVPASQSSPGSEGLYDIFHKGEQIGIGQYEKDKLLAVAALQKGRGADCVCAMSALMQVPQLRLLCAEENLPAMRLYDRLGFSRENCREVWYCVK